MTPNPYNEGLDRTPANHQPLTPLTFLERAATVFPDHTAIVHGPLRRSYAAFYARSRQLASALAGQGIGRGDTVSAMLAKSVGYSRAIRPSSRLAMKPPTPPPQFIGMPSVCSVPTTMSAP